MVSLLDGWRTRPQNAIVFDELPDKGTHARIFRRKTIYDYSICAFMSISKRVIYMQARWQNLWLAFAAAR